MKFTRVLILAGIIAASLPALTSTAAYGYEGYWSDSAGNIVKNGIGGCWHTIYWTPSMAVAGCDPVTEIKVTHPIISSHMPTTTGQAKMIPAKVNLSGDDLFDFNQAVLKPKGKETLDSLAHNLVGKKYDSIHVIGYTDRIGSAKFNKKLSIRRAEAVESYLVGKGIPASRIQVEGKGKTHPITKPSDCSGMTKVKMIACLQPDRRVEVVVDGAK